MLQSFGRSFKPITPRSLSVLSIAFVIVVVSVPVQGILPVFSWRSTLHDYASFYFEAARYKTRPVMIKRQVLFRIQTTPALRTPRSITPPCYYGQQQNPRQKLQTFDWNKLPLLRTLATTDLRTLYSVSTSQYYCFLSRTPSSILEYLHIYQVYFFCFLRLSLSFLVDFRFFCPSIKIPSSFSPEAFFAVSLPRISSSSLWWFKWLTGQTQLLLVKIRKLWPSKLCSNEYLFQRLPFII